MLANDTDPNGFPLTAGAVTGSTCASVALNPDGSFNVTGSGASCPFSLRGHQLAGHRQRPGDW